MKQIQASLEPCVGELRDYCQWQQSNPRFSLMAYAGQQLTPDLAIAAGLFWPEFVSHQGGVFLADTFDEATFQRWFEALGGDIRAVEQMMNHRHVCDLVPSSSELGKDNICFFGSVLANLWQRCLETQFPERRFHVGGEWDDPSQDLLLTICQVNENGMNGPLSVAE